MEITVRCPSGREPDFSVRCQANWRVSELKQHLASVYPGCPAAESQRIVFAGRLLANDEILEQALQHSSAPGLSSARVVHLVLPCGVSAGAFRSSSAPAMTSSQPQQPPVPDELTALWQEYTQYVHSHYFSCCLTPSAAGPDPSSAAAAANPPAAAPQQQQQGDDDQVGGAAVEIGADGAIVGGAGGVGGFREWVHTALRCALMSLIIFYYSSPGKALSAFAIFFAMQAVQGGFLHRLRRFIWAAPPQQPRPVEEAAAAAAVAAAAAPPAAPETPQQRPAPQQASAAGGEAAAAAAAVVPHASLTATLAAFLDAVLTTIVAFFTSLIPDRPPPLANQ